MLTTRYPQWYAIRTRSRHERLCRDHLIAHGIECLLPLCKRITQWKGRRKQIEWPLFPSYCFGRFSFDQRIDVLQAPGVVEIIGSAHAAEPITAEAIVDTFILDDGPHDLLMLQRAIAKSLGRAYESARNGTVPDENPV